MPRIGQKEIQQLAAALRDAYVVRNRAGVALHDRVGPLLTAAGLRLQLLRMDHPGSEEAVTELMGVLDQAMEHVRAVSQTLAPSPAYRIGLKAALERVIGERQDAFPGVIRLKFSSSARLDRENAVLLYGAIEAALTEALSRPGATKVSVSVTGVRHITACVQDNGNGAPKVREALPMLLAEAGGFALSEVTRKGTIVLIRHGISRSARG